MGKDSGKLKNKMWGKDEDLNLIFTVDLVRERESFPSMEGSVTNVHSHNNVLLSKLETCQYHYHIRNWEHRASEGKGGKK